MSLKKPYLYFLIWDFIGAFSVVTKYCNEFISYTRYLFASTGGEIVALITNIFINKGDPILKEEFHTNEEK